MVDSADTDPSPGSRWTVPALVALAILVASVLPVSGGSGPDSLIPFLPGDKLVHFMVYLALAGSVAWAMGDRGTHPWRVGLLLFGLVFLYGAGIEVVQHFVPSRSFSLLDMVANGLGAGVGILVGRSVGT